MSIKSVRPGKLVLIIGPSGVGKSVILKKLKERHPEIHFPKSATTRDRRKGEGDDLYRFVSDKEFDELLKNKKILEWAVVHGKERYGTLLDEILPWIEKGSVVLREVDIQGFESISKHPLFAGVHAPNLLQSIFILPESKDQLITHIRKRAPMDDEELQRRIASMESELERAGNCDVQVVNKEGQIEETLQAVESAIFS